MGRRTSGLYSGWGAYRYGESRGKAKRRPRLFEGPAREAVISKTAEILNVATFSKFQHEGACRHGLRTALVLSGHPWAPADLEAAAIVSAALAKIGAIRPTWEQGQPEYTDRHEQCSHCKGELTPDDFASGRRFCSSECAAAARVRRLDHQEFEDEATRQRLAYAYKREMNPARPCGFCGKSFRPSVAYARYCSTLCARLSRGDLVPDRECDHCGKTYHPPTVTAVSRFCSYECAGAAKRTRQPATCTVCGTVFTPKKPGQTACSRTCSRIEPGKLPPIPCIVCGTEFNPKTPWGKFCGATCRNRHNHALEPRAEEKSSARSSGEGRQRPRFDLLAFARDRYIVYRPPQNGSMRSRWLSHLG